MPNYSANPVLGSDSSIMLIHRDFRELLLGFLMALTIAWTPKHSEMLARALDHQDWRNVTLVANLKEIVTSSQPC